MYLEELSIHHDDGLVRRVEFRRGLNLIVDESTHSGASGSSVGKTTALRAISYILGGKPESMYMDREFRTENALVKNFILDDRTSFGLTLRSLDGRKVVLERRECPKGKRKRVYRIDGQISGSILDYRARLGQLFFGLAKSDKPSYRQVIAKFLRTEPEHMENVLRYLHGATTNTEYLATYSVLFGYTKKSLFSEQQAILGSLKAAAAEIDGLQSESTVRTREKVLLLENEIQRTQGGVDSGSELPDVADIWPRIRDNRDSLAALSTRAAQLHIREKNTRTALEQLDETSRALARTSLHELYSSTLSALGELVHDFDELVEFHTHLLESRRDFFLRINRRTSSEIEELERNISRRQRDQDELLSVVQRRGAYGRIVDSINHLSELKVQKARLEAELDALSSAEIRLSNFLSRLKDVESKIVASWSCVEDFVRLFNEQLEVTSRTVLGSPVRLTAVLDHSGSKGRGHSDLRVVFEPVELESNVGTGKKRAFVGCFDVAYTRTLSAAKTPGMVSFPRFSLLDLVENIAPTELGPLLRAANMTDGQFVVAALQERLASTVDPDLLQNATILRLSSVDRFLRLTR